ncbi:MAG: DUF624 domain-containing protein [Oscillospiraceae bacterium]|nr:DUF624 domain-containing protein [Oscillospiraceae bacterium]
MPVIPFFILITGGPAITALLYCTNKLVRTGSISDVSKTYFNIFKTYFKKTLAVGAIVTVMNIIFISGLVLYLSMSTANIMYIPFSSASLIGIIFLWAITIHLFPAFTEADKSTKEMLADAISAAVLKVKETLIAVVISLLLIGGIILMLPKSLPLLLTVVFSVPAVAAGFAHSDCEFISDII